jgi:glucose/arabinose dehydrogenase
MALSTQAVPLKADTAAPATTTTATVNATAAATNTLPGVVKAVWASGLRAPQGMARDAQGNIYVAEYQGGQVSKFSPEARRWAPSAPT